MNKSKIRRIIREEVKQLTERKEAPSALIDAIANMTDRNDHTGARRLLSAAVNAKKLHIAYNGLEATAEIFRHMPQSALKLRSELDQELEKSVIKAYNNADEIWSKL